MDIKASLEDENFALPALNPLIKLFGASPDRDGKPRWSLYHPAANKYYYIGWPEFECIARFHLHKNADALIDDVNKNTTLSVDKDDVKALVTFLKSHGLLELNGQEEDQTAAPKPLWERIVHGYLFFTLPLFKPQNFLTKSFPIVRPLFSKAFFMTMMIVLFIGVILTIQRLDEFTHTFLEMFSVKGAAITFLTFGVIKIIHEFSHAYTATKYGIKIPHMGAAFIVMYPVLYTETSCAWRLQSKSQRIQIGLAGVAAELTLAAIALILWHILPAGIERSIAFSVVAISLIGSLLVNLNPLMRFDGYFVLSDALNIENLHARAIALARWRLRKTLFGLPDPAPDIFPPSLQKFMQIFGFAIIIYRFFLFLGIAFLVYTVFFKPLGLLLMTLELMWFIGLPILSELKVWWKRKGDIFKQKQSYITCGVAIGALTIAFLPTQSHVTTTAVLHAQNERAIFAPSPAFIKELSLEYGQRVKKGEVLATLSSDALDQELETARTSLLNLQTQIRRERLSASRFKEFGSKLEAEISQKQNIIETLEKRKERLKIKAPFDGTIRDLSPQIHEQRYISSQELLFTVKGDKETTISAYIGENDLTRIKTGNTATFRPSFSLTKHQAFTLTEIDTLNTSALTKAELASVHGGHIPSSFDENGQAITLEPVYLIQLKPLENINNNDSNQDQNPFVQTGILRIQADNKSAVFSLANRFVALIIREVGLN